METFFETAANLSAALDFPASPPGMTRHRRTREDTDTDTKKRRQKKQKKNVPHLIDR